MASGMSQKMEKLNDLEVYELLRKIDWGYRPTPAEDRALAEREELNLSGTPITALPESLGQLANLQSLDLRGTQITALPELLGQLANLERLDLRGTQITALPESFSLLAKLQKLYLDNTQIIALPESFDRLAKLQLLSLSHTQITALPESFGRLAELVILYLNNTRITALPDWLGELPKLIKLDLRGLTLPGLPRSLALRGLPFVDEDFPVFTGVNLHGVTLTAQNKAVFLQNDRALIEALYEKEQLRLPECRVIFLGDGDSGKSYTIRRFRNGGRRETVAAPYETRETPGVEILNQDVSHEGSTLRLHFWDFGGQQLLHAMHRCFLTEDSCYVVTVKSRETKADLRARYWLRNVTAFAPKSPILLYVNCWDNDNGLRVLDEPRLRQDFPQIAGVVYVSAKTAGDGEFRERLMEPLIEIAAGTPGCHRRVPRSWKAVRDAIEAESQENNYLTKERYHQICAEYPDIRDENAPALLSYFNSLGVCFSYHRDERKVELADYRLLNPVWLTNAIYAIIEEGMVYARDGKIRDSAVRQMLCNRAPALVRGRSYRRTVPEIVYKAEECAYILDVARVHDLCYRVDSDQLFFPALCSTDSPPEALEAPGAGLRTLRYRMKYSYLPDNVLHRLMIRCMKQNFAVKSCWLRGLILADTEDHRVLIRMENDETLGIELWFRPDCPALSIFLWLREDILGINSALGLNARDFIVDDAEEQYSVVSLIEAAKDGSKVYGQNTGKKQDARALLGDYFESWTIEGMEVRENALVIPILPHKYHHAKQDDPKLRRALYEAYKGICPYCNRSLQDERNFEVDHIFPSKYQALPELAEYVKYLNAHGFDTAKPDYVENYFPAHHSCNLDKSNHTEPFALLAWHHRAARMAPKVLRLMGKSEDIEDN